ncbi:MAG TPA: ZIP family metal transporter [Candidatus Kryptonia bacterium]
MTVAIIGIATFISTLFGGLFALKYRDKLHLILGFSAGAVIGVAFFDLLPEAISLEISGTKAATTSIMIGVGFIMYLVLDRAVILLSKADEEHGVLQHRGTLGAASLSMHSFLDGTVIGFAFQVSAAVGAIVTAAVLTHDFSDGINTVSLILKDNGNRKKASLWLLTDALAPVLGILLTRFFTLPENMLGNVLAIFCGFFIYIGASELLPESYHAHPKVLTTVMTLLGISILYAVIQVAKG